MPRKSNPRRFCFFRKTAKLSESDIRKIADDEIGNVAAFEFRDYDKNGTKEAFIVSAKEDDEGYCELPWEVYFIDSEGNTQQMDSCPCAKIHRLPLLCGAGGICMPKSKQK